MSELRFATNFHSRELQSLALPVEVRKSNLALVARALSTQSVSVEPGIYHVTAKLPAGQELYSQVTVQEGVPATAMLELDPADVSPSESQEVQRYILGQQPLPQTRDRGLEDLGVDEVSAKLRLFKGNPLTGVIAQVDGDTGLQPLPAQVRGVARFEYSAEPGGFVQLLQPHMPPINVALPVSPPRGCQIIVTRPADGGLTIGAQLENVEANVILRYYEQALLEQAAITTSAESFEELLAGKVSDPTAAAVGAYTLLRFGELTRLHDWTRNLWRWFEWLPDGIPIWAEHLARNGEHQRALEILLDLPSRGLPFFSDGLSYAMNRLRLYTSLDAKHFPNLDRTKAVALLEQLQTFATVVDFRKPILTLTGLDLNRPDDDPFEENIDYQEGVDIAPYMG